ncbi:MAG: hypothetical protein NC222_06255 [Staphylococcus sp.]|nr:hypothetical protein [Staphylococcus sp.]
MAQYVSPGVSFIELQNASLSSTSTGFNTTAIIGLGRNWYQVSNLEIVKGEEDTDAILLPDGTKAEKGDILEFQAVGSIPAFYNFVKDTDYTIDEDNTTITWIGENKPTKGTSFYVKYKKNKVEEDYVAARFYDKDSLSNTFGPEFEDGVINTLTLGADLVLEGAGQSAGGVVCVQVKGDGTQESEWKAAIDKLDNWDIQTVIILKQDSMSLRSYLIQKVNELSTSLFGKERTTFITPLSDDVTADVLAAQRDSLMNDRVTYFANKKVTITLTDNKTLEEQNVEVDAIYACANLSGIEGNPEYTFSEPMLRKQLTSRITLSEKQRFNPLEKVNLCSNYLSVFEFDENNGLANVFDIFTTDSTNVVTETRSVRRVIDLLRKNIRTQLDKRYIGQKALETTAESAVATTSSILTNFVSMGEIGAYRNVSGAYDSVNPKQLNIAFEVRPIFELKWIKVTMSTYVA